MASKPTESPRKTVHDCIMRSLVCLEDASTYESAEYMDMIEIYENRIIAIVDGHAPRSVDLPVKLRAVATQLNQLARLYERHEQ
jgi:hypothetical protein